MTTMMSVQLAKLLPQGDTHGVSTGNGVEEVGAGDSTAKAIDQKCVAENSDFQALRYYAQLYLIVQEGNKAIMEITLSGTGDTLYDTVVQDLQGERCKQDEPSRIGYADIMRRCIYECVKKRLGNKKAAKKIREALGFPANKNKVKLGAHEQLTDNLTIAQINQLLEGDYSGGLKTVLKDIRGFVIMLNIAKEVNTTIGNMDADAGANSAEIDKIFFDTLNPMVAEKCKEENIRLGMSKLTEEISNEVLTSLMSELERLSCTEEVQNLLGGMTVNEYTAQEGWVSSLANAMKEAKLTPAGSMVADGEEHTIVLQGLFSNFTEDTEVIAVGVLNITETNVLNPNEIEVTYSIDPLAEGSETGMLELRVDGTGNWYTASFEKVEREVEGAQETTDITFAVEKNSLSDYIEVSLFVPLVEEPIDAIAAVETAYQALFQTDKKKGFFQQEPSTLDSWTNTLRKYGLSPMLSVGMGFSLSPQLDSRVVGDTGSSADGLNLFYNAAASLGWSPYIGNDYKLTLNPYGAFNYSGLHGKSEAPGIYNVDTGLNFYLQRKDPYSHYPSFRLGLSYDWDGVDIPTSANPDGKAFNLSVGANETIYKPLSLDLGYDLMAGSFNGRKWLTQVPSAGLKFNINSSISFMAGYRLTLAQQERVLLSGSDVMQMNMGHGAYAGAVLGFGQAGTLKLFGSYDHMEAWEDQAAAALEYTIPFPKLDLDLGVSYERQNLYNGFSDEVLGKIGISNLALTKSGSKGGLNLYGSIFVAAGWRQNDFASHSNLTDDYGFVGLGGIKLTFGIDPDVNKTENAASNALDAYLTNPVAEESEMFSDPLIDISERVFDNHDLLMALAFKLGCLGEVEEVEEAEDEAVEAEAEAGDSSAKVKVDVDVDLEVEPQLGNYELNEAKLRQIIDEKYNGSIIEAIKDLDGGSDWYGSQIVEGVTVVNIGDVAPFGFLLGGQNPNAMPADQEGAYVKSIIAKSPRKSYVAGVICPTRDWIAEEQNIPVDKSNEATWLTWKLIAAVAVMSDFKPGDDKYTVLNFVDKFWKELSSDFKFPEGLDKEEKKEHFMEHLYAELSGQVVGKAVMTVARVMLKIQEKVTAATADKMTSLSKANVYDLINIANIKLKEPDFFYPINVADVEEAAPVEGDLAPAPIEDYDPEYDDEVAAGPVHDEEPAPEAELAPAVSETAPEAEASPDGAEDSEMDNLGIE